MAELKSIIEESFSQYAGAVLQSRALIDVRDCIKPSARQIFYCMYTDKFIADKPFRKTLKAIGSAMRVYIHGDSSCEGVIMRAGQPFSMRYPLIEVEGSYGNLMESGNWSAPRYTSARLSAISDKLFKDIEKNTIDDWRDNYDDTEKYPAVLPTKGYYNICNGSFGLGVGMSSSIPQFNIREVNQSLEKLLLNPSVDDEEIIVMPDFATGAYLLNPEEVKESLKNGTGKSCLLRASISYDNKENCLIVTEIPYSVYTNTICGELEQIINGENNCGIDRFNDLTGATPLIKIYLTKNANPNSVMNYLYKNTSLQYWYGINLTMLENGRYPKLFTWKEALQSHIEHEKVVYRRGFEFDRNKAESRLHIVEGLLIALANIDEVVHTIRSSASSLEASVSLQKQFLLTEAQTKAILDMKLSRLAHLEVEKLKREENDLIDTIRRINEILSNEQLFNQQLINGWHEVSNKFGDERRTKIIYTTEKTPETIENKDVVVLVSDKNEFIVTNPFDKMNTSLKSSELHKMKFKIGYQAQISDTIYAYDKVGKVYPINLMQCPITVDSDIIGLFNTKEKQYIIYVTNKGTVKKTFISDYNGFKRNPLIGKLRDREHIIYAASVSNEDYLFLLGVNGKVLKVSTTDFNSTGRNTIGVKGMACDVVAATAAANEQKIVVIGNEKYKVTNASEYAADSRNNLGRCVAEHTNKLFVIPKQEFYLIENYNKITFFNKDSYILKNKQAQGNKVSKEVSVIW